MMLTLTFLLHRAHFRHGQSTGTMIGNLRHRSRGVVYIFGMSKP